MRRLFVLLLCGLGTSSALAEMDGEAYGSGASLQSQAERAAAREAIAAERIREQESAREQEANAVQLARALSAAEARKPAVQRLFEAKCRSCHTLEVVEARRHSLPGWAFTVARMRWWNGADISLADLIAITGYLARWRAAEAQRAVLEWTVALVLAILSAVPTWRKVCRKQEESG